jgi:transcriptional regulator of arginine metabolism
VSRRERERAILEIVDAQAIHTQADLVRALHERGARVTQATVSRDVKRLGLVKLPGPDGTYRYGLPEAATIPSRAAHEALASAFDEFTTGVFPGEGLLAVKTLSGCANAVAITIDEAALPGVVATLAGDDTIFILAASRREASQVLEQLRNLL